MARARELLAEGELLQLIEGGQAGELVHRLDQIGKANNLLWRRAPMRGDLGILYQPDLDRPSFGEAVFDLLYGPGQSSARLGRYLGYVRDHALPNKWTFPTYFLFVCHPDTEMFVKPAPLRAFLDLLGCATVNVYGAPPDPATYQAICDLAGELREGMASFGPLDNVDIQGAIWAVYSALAAPPVEAHSTLQALFPRRDEATWAFELVARSVDRPGGAGSPRLSLTLPPARGASLLRLSFGPWTVLEFVRRHAGAPDAGLMVHLPLPDLPSVMGYPSWKLEPEPGGGTPLRMRALPGALVAPGAAEPSQMEGELRHAFDAVCVRLATLTVDGDQGAAVDRWAGRDGGLLRLICEPGERSRLLDALYDPALHGVGLPLGIVPPDGAEAGEGLAAGVTDEDGAPDEAGEAVAEPTTGYATGAYVTVTTAPQVAAPPETPPQPPVLQPEYSLAECAADTGWVEATLAEWVGSLERKRQAILYGPPGTGKTHLARALARHLVGGGDGFVDLVQFHPAYAYEDFVQGIRPQSANGALTYPLAPGRFLEFCHEATRRHDRCVLIVDEINRADLPRVFGELMYLLEYRDERIPLAGGGPYSPFAIPANVRLLGTMNTADRSIALVDYALRRRFAFLPVYPNYDVLRRYHAGNGAGFSLDGLINTLARLNAAIGDPHYAVGITYFLRPDLAGQIAGIWRTEIEPYLEEYFFDQPERARAFAWENVCGAVLA